MKREEFLLPSGATIRLKDYSPSSVDAFPSKLAAEEKLQSDIAELAKLQDKLYAQNTYALLIVLQGIDASGKDGTIKHVMSGVNPSGCQVKSFKVPSAEELAHDYLWRYGRALPERGKIAIFNRSYYEEVLVVRVHLELLAREHIDTAKKQANIWKKRFAEINEFEHYLTENNIEILKFFLHLSKDKQKKRFLDRLNSPEKNWKFSEGDVLERDYWEQYQEAFEDMLNHTSTPHAPWHIVPADHKWFTHLVVADAIVAKLQSLALRYPELSDKDREALERAKKLLNGEK
jgi:PPK2 family polyphosphate:nucleotide phosphotransferase